MKFSIDIKLEVDQKQFNFHINNVYHGKIHSIVPFDGKVTITGDFTLAEKTEIENYYISLPLFEEDYTEELYKQKYIESSKIGQEHVSSVTSKVALKITTLKVSVEESEVYKLGEEKTFIDLKQGEFYTAYQSHITFTPISELQVIYNETTQFMKDFINSNYPTEYNI